MISYSFIDSFLENILDKNKCIALGSSTTSYKVIKQMALHNTIKDLSLRIYPSDKKIIELAKDFSFELAKVNDNIDIAIEFPDFADSFFNYIKNSSSSLIIDKIIAKNASKTFIFIRDAYFENYHNIKISCEVFPFALKHTLLAISSFGDAEIRKNDKGFFKTIGGNYIVDFDYCKKFSFEELESSLKDIPGVLETSLFISLADKIFTISEKKIKLKVDRL